MGIFSLLCTGTGIVAELGAGPHRGRGFPAPLPSLVGHTPCRPLKSHTATNNLDIDTSNWPTLSPM